MSNQRKDFTPAQLATAAKVPRQCVYEVLASLVERGLAVERRSGKQRLFQAVDPTPGLAGLLQTKQQQYEAELERQRQQTEQMTALLGPLHIGQGIATKIPWPMWRCYRIRRALQNGVGCWPRVWSKAFAHSLQLPRC